jgi:phosphatidylinositol alpha 1,6-mannosyltransferase
VATGGALELVAHGRTGLLVQPDDPGALAAALIDLAESPARRAALGAAGIEAARARTWDGAIDQLVGVYGSLLGLEPETALAAA